MKEKIKTIFRGPVAIYPLLFTIYPILFLYAHNMSEMSASQVWLPLAVSVAFTLLLWAILSLILQSLSKAGLATAIFIVLFFSYGHLYEALETQGVFMPKHAHLLPSMLFIWGYGVYFISRAKRDFRITTNVLNIMAVVLITINLFNIGAYQVKIAKLSAGAPVESPEYSPAAASPTELSALPDIYFIILDEYAHPDTMKEWYDYDSSWFIKSLEDKGFFIASQSKTRTPSTSRAIAQVLNMEYLTGELNYQKIAYSRVADFLKAQGYQYIAFGSQFTRDRWDSYMKDNADHYFNYHETAGSPMVTEFQDILWNTTMLRPFYPYIVGGRYRTFHRRGVLDTLEHVRKVPDMEGPKFVFVHFMSPHAPFIFGPRGEFVAPVNRTNYKDRQFYLGQYIFITGEIEKVVDALLKKSETPPIIIIQSDHGPRPPLFPIGREEWRKILNALYLPGVDKAMLYDSISPVNTFRLIFNHYFGADYPLLEDD